MSSPQAVKACIFGANGFCYTEKGCKKDGTMIAPGTNALVLLIEDDETKARAAQDIILYAEKKSFQGDSADLKKFTKPKSIR
jgi:hypothetical protein